AIEHHVSVGGRLPRVPVGIPPRLEGHLTAIVSPDRKAPVVATHEIRVMLGDPEIVHRLGLARLVNLANRAYLAVAADEQIAPLKLRRRRPTLVQHPERMLLSRA